MFIRYFWTILISKIEYFVKWIFIHHVYVTIMLSYFHLKCGLIELQGWRIWSSHPGRWHMILYAPVLKNESSREPSSLAQWYFYCKSVWNCNWNHVQPSCFLFVWDSTQSTSRYLFWPHLKKCGSRKSLRLRLNPAENLNFLFFSSIFLSDWIFQSVNFFLCAGKKPFPQIFCGRLFSTQAFFRSFDFIFVISTL